jgi:hypothetical protein
MPNITRTSKGGRSVDTSDLLAGKKRDILLAVAKSKDAANNRKSLIKQPGFNTGFMEMTAKNGLDLYNSNTTITAFLLNGAVLAVIKVNGYTLGNVTPAMTNAFKNAFASTYGVNPNLISIRITPGSMIIEVSVEPLSSIDLLDLDDKTFFSNIDSVVKGIQPSDVSALIATAQIPQSSINPTGPLSIDTTATVVNTTVDVVVAACEDSEYTNSIFTNLNNPLVGDPINNCMYTLISGTYTNNFVVRINANGTMDKICDYVENQGCRHIFINAESTHLIIPSKIIDTVDSGSVLSPGINKIRLVNITTGIIKTITVTSLNADITHGFDKLTRRFYFTSSMRDTYLKLAYVTIPADYESATVSATFYTSLSAGNRTKLEFVDSNNAYVVSGYVVQKINFDPVYSDKTRIAGVAMTGNWSNTVDGWDSAPGYGPFLDAPIGTNAFFSITEDLVYDSENNRLLVCDLSAQRIRSVSLSGTNAVTTFAGTSPTYLGYAINSGSSGFSQQVLDSLAQIGLWGGINLPPYTKVNGPLLTATFKEPSRIILFNNKIYVTTSDGTKQISNGYVSDFTVIKNF